MFLFRRCDFACVCVWEDFFSSRDNFGDAKRYGGPLKSEFAVFYTVAFRL